MIVARRRPEDFSPTVQRLLAIGTAWHMEQHGDEFGAFLEWLLSGGGPGGAILEIGARQGGTAAVWASLPTWQQTNPVPVVVIDQETERVALRRLERDLRVISIIGDSHDPLTLTAAKHYFCGTYGMLFLDGDHSARGVQQDVDDYSPLVRPGGLVVFHDIVDTPHMRSHGHGVCDVWQALPGEKTEFLLGDAPWGGIGVWRKP